ncbi:hypothetical protein A2316_03835 [Candidatus Falkowbacteria bacterium RIFOXYB2_FULL_38_15]|uniref:Uncharacterized protein n=1 Tax=Candidatus Falkowbacteria bacterium RIFOXYA2_FULL_38_12 TaxID=1797993 RepID=A0A1F5S1S3_9BACT|nr:MAG: hypothetical protein A2257_01290 [Candidatus Falkowbacteria bacterium RIFOXYA2_FULL_38_12]OGF32590.1 MAG: hypothetical protein A2316_03835 [Candidatus Falkowbacteria bacterium RIFOXYB2_FULL_38_15]OGF42112.1 MAG: hypothetical protein A2555_03340 [Candidatus Falkowbacteria bacterium RIFOXYD2_FULL_39_16]
MENHEFVRGNEEPPKTDGEIRATVRRRILKKGGEMTHAEKVGLAFMDQADKLDSPGRSEPRKRRENMEERTIKPKDKQVAVSGEPPKATKKYKERRVQETSYVLPEKRKTEGKIEEQSIVLNPDPEVEALLKEGALKEEIKDFELERDREVREKLSKAYWQDKNSFSGQTIDGLNDYNKRQAEIIHVEGEIFDLRSKIRVKGERVEKLSFFDKIKKILRGVEKKESRGLEGEIAELAKRVEEKNKYLAILKEQQRNWERKLAKSSDKKVSETAKSRKRPESEVLPLLSKDLVKQNAEEMARSIEWLDAGIEKITAEKDSLSRWDHTFFPWKEKRLEAEIKVLVEKKKDKEEELTSLSKEHNLSFKKDIKANNAKENSDRAKAEMTRIQNKVYSLEDKIKIKKERRKTYGWFSKQRAEIDLEIEGLDRERKDLKNKASKLKREKVFK